MSMILFSNNAKTVLGAGASNTDTTFILETGAGSLFPAIAANQIVVLTLSSAPLRPFITEVVHCTGISGDTLTVVRAQEGTTAQTWLAGDYVANLMTAGTGQNFMQVNSGTTGNRPVPSMIGQFYYDTTLGYPIYCNQITPSVVWHNSQGSVV